MPTTLILGASDKPERFSYRALHKLKEHGHNVLLVSPKGGLIDGINCFTSLDQVSGKIDTITVYVNPSIFSNELQKIININPRRVIFNPGTESPEAAALLKSSGIEVVENCTLVMLNVGIY